jgi:hypothetical protein
MKSVRRRVTYANVMSSLAVFLVVAGGSALAAGTLGKNTVGTKQLKNNAVTGAKIKNGAITGAKLKLSSIGKVPSATTADTATTAITATTAGTAKSAGTADTANVATTAGTANLAKTLPGVVWKPVTLENGWATYDPEYYGGAPTYTKDAQGFVHLDGAIEGTTATSTVVGYLPAGFRPPSGVWLLVPSTNGSSDPQVVNMEITPEGEMLIYDAPGADNGFVSFDGVEFYAGN